jgi:hypothetical protein
MMDTTKLEDWQRVTMMFYALSLVQLLDRYQRHMAGVRSLTLWPE